MVLVTGSRYGHGLMLMIDDCVSAAAAHASCYCNFPSAKFDGTLWLMVNVDFRMCCTLYACTRVRTDIILCHSHRSSLDHLRFVHTQASGEPRFTQ